MKIYKVRGGSKGVPVRSGASKYTKIIRVLLEGDKIFSRVETHNYVKIDWVELYGSYGNDPMGHGWVNKKWLVYRGEG